MTESLNPKPQEQLSSHVGIEAPRSETLITPEAMEAASSIAGVGALAVDRTISTVADPKPGFMRRSWDSIKASFDPRNTAGGKAVVESGQTFTKWEIARSVTSRFVESGRLVASISMNIPIMGLVPNTLPDQRGRVQPSKSATSAANRLNKRVDSFASGTENTILRRKMAAAQQENQSSNGPVQNHLDQYGRNARRKVTAEQDRLEWRNKNPHVIAVANMMGGTALGAAASVAPVVARHLF